MKISSRGASKRCVRIVGLAFLTICFHPLPAAAYDLELDAGIRAGSGDPSAVAKASWDAAKLSGPFAFGTSGMGEASLDAGGNPGVDASLRGEASYAEGAFVSGLRLDLDAFRSVEIGEESIDARISVPFTRNGEFVSLSFIPSVGEGFYDDESVYFGAGLSLSYLAGDFLLKPGAVVRRIFYPDDARTLELRPSLGFVWYPGIPVSADLSFAWSRSETDEGDATTSYPFSASLSAVPLPWLCLTAEVEGEGDVTGFMSYRAGGEVEFIKYGRHGRAFHLPIAGYYSWTEDGQETFGASVLIGFSFGSE